MLGAKPRLALTVALADRTGRALDLYVGETNVGFCRSGRVVWIDPRYQSLWDDAAAQLKGDNAGAPV